MWMVTQLCTGQLLVGMLRSARSLWRMVSVPMCRYEYPQSRYTLFFSHNQINNFWGIPVTPLLLQYTQACRFCLSPANNLLLLTVKVTLSAVYRSKFESYLKNVLRFFTKVDDFYSHPLHIHLLQFLFGIFQFTIIMFALATL